MKEQTNNDFIIVSDGSCDLPDTIVQEKQIQVVPFYVSFDGNTYLKEKKELDVNAFYERLVEDPNLFPSTALPSVNDYIEVFETALQAGKGIICATITSKFSGSYNSAMVAKNTCLEKYPNAKIAVIDSMVNTGVQGLFVLELMRMKENGLSFDEIVKKAEKIKKTGRIFFTVGSLDYLRHGGRIGKLIGLVGSTLKIKPIIVLKEGEIFSEGLAFTRKKSFLKATSLAQEYFTKNKQNPDEYQFITGYGYDKEEADNFQQKIQELFHREDVLQIHIGATIGVHTGPHPIGLGFIKKYEYC